MAYALTYIILSQLLFYLVQTWHVILITAVLVVLTFSFIGAIACMEPYEIKTWAIGGVVLLLWAIVFFWLMLNIGPV